MGFYLYNCKMKYMPVKKMMFLLSLSAVIIYSVGCKKCYTCQNTCLKCTAAINGHVSTQVLCRDSFADDGAYNAAYTADTGMGYICTATASTYTYDFCENQPGVKNGDTSYFDHGGRAPCTVK
jgi:hypothetical protein